MKILLFAFVSRKKNILIFLVSVIIMTAVGIMVVVLNATAEYKDALTQRCRPNKVAPGCKEHILGCCVMLARI